MKLKKNILLIISITSFFLFTRAEKRMEFNYNFDVPLPFGGVRLYEAFPSSIRNHQRVIKKMDLPDGLTGYETSYNGDEFIMTTIQARTAEQAEQYFAEELAPRFRDMRRYRVEKTAKRWRATGEEKNGSLSLGWTSETWILVLTGASREHLDLLVRASRFIEPL